MKVLLTPQAATLINQDLTAAPVTGNAGPNVNGAKSAIANTIRLALDKLHHNEYFLCTVRGVRPAVTTFSGTSLAIFYDPTIPRAIVFDTESDCSVRNSSKKYFDSLAPTYEEFFVL